MKKCFALSQSSQLVSHLLSQPPSQQPVAVDPNSDPTGSKCRPPSHEPSQKVCGIIPSQLVSQLVSQVSAQLSSQLSQNLSLRAGEGSGTIRQKGGNGRLGREDRPAAVATRSQPPPIARTVNFAPDRRFVRLVVRWEPPAADLGEHHREVDEHRISGSLHRPASK